MASLPHIGLAADDDLEARKARIASLPEVSPWPNDWFRPKETVAGGSATLDLREVDGFRNKPGAQAVLAYMKGQFGDGLIAWHDGQVLLSEFSETSGGPTARFNSFHMHWNVLITAFGRLLSDGSVKSLDDSAAVYLPEWQDDPRAKITLRHLLTMVAGLETYIDSSDPESLSAEMFYGPSRVDAVLHWPLEMPPGQEFGYNYAIPETLGLILERASGQRYADYVSKTLWRPLGNRDAYVWLDEPRGRAYQNAVFLGAAVDWLNLAILTADRGLFGGDTVIDPAWFDAMMTPSQTNPNFGFTWLGSPYTERRQFSKYFGYYAFSSEPYKADDMVIMDGYVNRVFVSPKNRLAIVYVGKGGRISGDKRGKWDDSVIPNAIMDALGA